MEYRFLGNSGLKVSVLSYGNWLTNNDPSVLEQTIEIVKRCYDLGINFFDSAEGYGAGEAERQLGIALQKLNVPRQNLVVSTKIFFGTSKAVNGKGTSRKHLIEGLQASLKRLQLDYVDVVYAHRYDSETPIEETCRAFNYLIDKGLAFYWGTSEWSAEQIGRAMEICEKLNLIKPITEQPQYNIFVREKLEVEYVPLFNQYKLGTTVWSPLAGGILTGKYNEEIPKESRIANADPFIKGFYDKVFFGEKVYEQKRKAMKEFEVLARELGCTQAQLALAWVIYNKDVSTAIFGATRTSQVDDNLKALDVYHKLTKEILDKIEKIFESRPETAVNYKTWQPFPPRR
jgi:voltage-dependent potassium channel beta subunit